MKHKYIFLIKHCPPLTTPKTLSHLSTRSFLIALTLIDLLIFSPLQGFFAGLKTLGGLLNHPKSFTVQVTFTDSRIHIFIHSILLYSALSFPHHSYTAGSAITGNLELSVFPKDTLACGLEELEITPSGKWTNYLLITFMVLFKLFSFWLVWEFQLFLT